MEINVIEKTKTKLFFELKGQGHSLCNALKDELYNDKNVVAASYVIEHPDIGNPKFLLEVSSGADTLKALKNAVSRLKKKNESFVSAAAKAIK